VSRSSSPKRYIIRSDGRLANQLMCIREILREDETAQIYAPYFDYHGYRKSFQLDRTLVSKETYWETSNTFEIYSLPKPSDGSNDYLSLFKTDSDYERLKPYFELTPSQQARCEDLAQRLFPDKHHHIAIHYRGGDFKWHWLKHEGHVYKPLKDYFKLTESVVLQKQRESNRPINIVVFSDESLYRLPCIAGVQLRRARDETQGDPVVDLYLMAHCETIIANHFSTYAYWASYIGSCERLCVAADGEKPSTAVMLGALPRRMLKEYFRRIRRLRERIERPY
jgi:hypothetical protein